MLARGTESRDADPLGNATGPVARDCGRWYSLLHCAEAEMTTKILLGFAVLVVAAWELSAQSALDLGTFYKQTSPAVVLIEALGSDGKVARTGSGLLVSADGKFLTNYHVVAHSKQATVKLANGDAYDIVEVIAIDKRKDIAFLKIPAVELPFVKLGRSSAVEIGQTIYSISSPLGLQNTLSQGLVSGIREMDGYRLFQISAAISHGSSGGPVFSTNGEAIGIAVLTIEGGQNLNFAIPIDYARGMLGMSQTQTLASIYEPEPPPDSTPEAKTEAAKVPATGSEPAIPDEMRKGAMVFLEKTMGVWHLDDARRVLGQPVRQRDALAGTTVDGQIYAFPDPTKGMREFELNFSTAGVLRAVYAYPNAGQVRLQDLQQLYGRKYRETKNPNGTHFYTYTDRRLTAFTDKNGVVINIGVYLP
jgi:hypothetical protein